jgi:hypothetical protein
MPIQDPIAMKMGRRNGADHTSRTASFVAAAAPGGVKTQTADKTRGDSAAAPAEPPIATRANPASVSAGVRPSVLRGRDAFAPFIAAAASRTNAGVVGLDSAGNSPMHPLWLPRGFPSGLPGKP